MMEHNSTEEQKQALWMEKYGPSLDRESPVEWEGKLFVLAGLKVLEEETGISFEEELTRRGALIRKDVSGRSDYLVVDPRWGYESKLRAAMVQRAKGKAVKIILGSDLLKSLTQPQEAPAPVEEPVPAQEAVSAAEPAPSRREELVRLCEEQEAIIAASKGWFGESARRRKAAQAKLEELRQTISREFPAETA